MIYHFMLNKADLINSDLGREEYRFLLTFRTFHDRFVYTTTIVMKDPMDVYDKLQNIYHAERGIEGTYVLLDNGLLHMKILVRS